MGQLEQYPDPAQAVTSCSFKAGAYGYTLMCFFPGAVGGLLTRDLYDGVVWSPAWCGPVIASLLLITAALSAIFLGTLRLDISEQGISYSNLFRKRFVAFSDISTAVLINFRVSRPVLYDPRRWTLLITPNPWTHRPPFKIPLTVFQTGACEELARLLHTGVGCPP